MAKNKLVFEQKNTSLNEVYYHLIEAKEKVQQEKEQKEKEVLYEQLNEITRNKEIILSNSLKAY